jgi:hypothetical protein
LKIESIKEDDYDLGNQFQFRALDLVFSILTTGSNKVNNLGGINISSSEINKQKTDFAKKYNDLYTADETEALSNN